MTRRVDRARIAQLEKALGYESSVDNSTPRDWRAIADRYMASCGLAFVVAIIGMIPVSSVYGDVPAAPWYFEVPLFTLLGWAFGSPALVIAGLVVYALTLTTLGRDLPWGS